MLVLGLYICGEGKTALYLPPMTGTWPLCLAARPSGLLPSCLHFLPTLQYSGCVVGDWWEDGGGGEQA